MKQPFDHGPMIGMIQIVADEHRCVGHLLFKAERPASTARRDARNPPIPDRGNISRRLDHRLFDCSDRRSEDNTSELQSLMRNSYAVFRFQNNRTILAHIYSSNRVLIPTIPHTTTSGLMQIQPPSN